MEFLDVIGPLTDPRAHGKDPSAAFDLVIPSLPGFAFSAPLTSRGWSTRRTAAAWAELMRRPRRRHPRLLHAVLVKGLHPATAGVLCLK